MPLPKPTAGEDEKTFIRYHLNQWTSAPEHWFLARCMGDKETQAIIGKTEAESQSMRAAACYRIWNDAKSSADPTIEAKSFGSAIEIKDEATGQVEAIVATLGVKDNDGDLIPVDALTSGAPATISMYDHDSIRNMMLGTGLPDQPPVGKGQIFVEGDKAVFKGRYFTETQRGREAFLTFKAIGEGQEWSFGYKKERVDRPTPEMRAKGITRVLAKLGPIAGRYEVSPVPVGGDVGTRTVAMRAADAESAQEDKSEPVTKSVDGVEHGRADFAYAPGDDVSDWKFPIFDAIHVQEALARLDQEKGIPAAELPAVREKILAAAHKHGVNPKSLEPGKKSAADQVLEQRIARTLRTIGG